MGFKNIVLFNRLVLLEILSHPPTPWVTHAIFRPVYSSVHFPDQTTLWHPIQKMTRQLQVIEGY